MKTILILGANSGMAKPLARRLVLSQAQLVLAGRNLKELEASAADLAIRSQGPKPMVFPFDIAALENHGSFLAQVLKKVKNLDEAYLFVGCMHEQKAAESDPALAREMLMANYVGAVSILECLAGYMGKRGQGLIVGVSSVAGDRGRQSNYIYGSSKAGLSVYLQGLRNRLAPKGVHVMTVKPGMVDTAMTRNMRKGLLFAKPDAIAKGILKAVRRKKNVVYLPGFWRWIMLIIRMVPEGVFKKMKM